MHLKQALGHRYSFGGPVAVSMHCDSDDINSITTQHQSIVITGKQWRSPE